MKITPSMKGELTKIRNSHAKGAWDRETLFNGIRRVFLKTMPAQQAKHATRKYIASYAL